MNNINQYYNNSSITPFSNPSSSNEDMDEYFFELGLALMMIIMFNMICQGYDVVFSTDSKGHPHISVVAKKNSGDSPGETKSMHSLSPSAS